MSSLIEIKERKLYEPYTADQFLLIAFSDLEPVGDNLLLFEAAFKKKASEISGGCPSVLFHNKNYPGCKMLIVVNLN